MNIFLLEDDFILNEIIEEHLVNRGFEVTTAFDYDEAIESLYSCKYDLLLLDVNLPKNSGFELLEDLRKNQIKTPAIFITSLSMADDVEKGFLSGCNDYIKKPFELKELDIRIENIKKMFNIDTKNILEISSNISFDKQNLSLKIENEIFHLAKKEAEILEYFIKNHNKIVSIEELSCNVWAYEESPTASTIRTYIKNIRKIVGDSKISNIRGVGYRFNK